MKKKIAQPLMQPLQTYFRKRSILTTSESQYSIQSLRQSSKYYRKLDSINKKYENLKNDIQKDYKNIYKQKKQLKIINANKDTEIAATDENLDRNLQKYSEFNEKKNKIYNKFKELALPDINEKEPIKRMKAKSDLKQSPYCRISYSDVCSLSGRSALMKSKRNFGELSHYRKISNELQSEKESDPKNAFLMKNLSSKILKKLKKSQI